MILQLARLIRKGCPRDLSAECRLFKTIVLYKCMYLIFNRQDTSNARFPSGIPVDRLTETPKVYITAWETERVKNERKSNQDGQGES
jgi:hypothetical protein